MSRSLIITVENLMRLLCIPFNAGILKTALQSHPDFPSLLAISEVLPRWGIDTDAIETTPEDLSGADYPGIALLKTNEYVILKKRQGDTMHLLHPQKGDITLPFPAFAAAWSGILLTVRPQAAAGEPEYRANRFKDLLFRLRNYLALPLFFSLFILVLVPGLKSSRYIPGLLPVLALKLLGLAACLVLLMIGLGNENITRNLCPVSEKLNCHAAINSAAGKLFGVPMTDIGLLYFSGGMLAIIISLYLDRSYPTLVILAYLNTLCLPYAVFSIVYQKTVLKTWCWLCLVVQAVFALEFVFLSKFIFQATSLFPPAIPLPIILGFSWPVLFWSFLRPILTRARAHKTLEIENLRMRRSPSYIKAQLENTRTIDMADLPAGIDIGPRDARTTLTLVLSPFCSYCADVYRQTRQMLRQRKELRAQIFFLLPGLQTGEGQKKKPPARHDYQVAVNLLALKLGENDQLLEQALEDWFTLRRRRYTQWIGKYSPSSSALMQEAEALLQEHNAWARKNALSDTPTLFLDGAKLPIHIRIEDLEYYLLRIVRE